MIDLSRRVWPWMSVLIAVVVLNGFVTFHNLWPTLGIHWVGELSVELAALLLVLTIARALFGKTPRPVIAILSGLLVVFALGRYGEVTAPALYGREVNLYWDLPNVTSVIGMLSRVASVWTIVGVCVAIIVALALLYFIARWSLRCVDAALNQPRVRVGFGVASLLLLGCFVAQEASEATPKVPKFSIPVSKTYSVQIARIINASSSTRAALALPPSPPLQSSFNALAGSDVLLVFEESYGSTTYDNPDFVRTLAPVRERLAAAVQDTGRGVVSAFVTSPTFGGSSWFAHISLLSGIEVRDPERYALLMTQKRATLASLFKHAGYRTIAVMPGLHETWPEGVFYQFDQVYNLEKLNYHGPAFGWWKVPDQFSLAEIDSQEIQRTARKPVFAFFPTVSTHFPFRPTPPVQANWDRVLTQTPFDAEPLKQSLAETPEWTDMGKSYAGSVLYFFDTVATYLRARPNDNFVIIILGDHQPAANVSGEGASWDIPVHIIARNPQILAALRREGFSAGLNPARTAIGKMNELTPMLLGAFDQTATAPMRAALPVTSAGPRAAGR